MKEKRITLRVSEDTYSRWLAAAKQDDRSLATWACRRIDGKDAVTPRKDQTEVVEVAASGAESKTNTVEVIKAPARSTNIFEIMRQKAIEDSEKDLSNT